MRGTLLRSVPVDVMTSSVPVGRLAISADISATETLLLHQISRLGHDFAELVAGSYIGDEAGWEASWHALTWHSVQEA